MKYYASRKKVKVNVKPKTKGKKINKIDEIYKMLKGGK